MKRAILAVLILAALVVAVFVHHCPVWALAITPWILGGIFAGTTLGVTSTQNRYQDKVCTTVVSNNFDTHGTITRSSVEYLTPAEQEALFRPGGLFAEMDTLLRTQFEMKACGTKINGLYDWLMSSSRQMGPINVEHMDRGPSLMAPFILGRQDSVINSDYWAIAGGAANSAYTGNTPASPVGTATAGPLTTADKALGAAGDRVIRVVTRYGIDMDAKWFLNRDRIFIWTMRVGGATERGVWKVLASEVSSDLSYVDVLVTDENSGSSTLFNTAPTSGVVVLGANNVSDWESYCQNRPTLDPRKRVPFWYQTMRRARRVDSEYKKVFARLMESNEYFQQFGDLPMAQRNAQDERDYQKRWVNSFFWGKPISANQTLASWKNLEIILSVTGSTVDPGQGGKPVAYRANMIGVYEQLKACARVFDLANNGLNFYEWLDENYRIYRARDSQGKTVDSIDWFTNAPYAALLETAFINYYKAEYADLVRINVDGDTSKSDEFGFHWKSFEVKFPAGIRINIITHRFFDDIRAVSDAEGIVSTGNFLMALEMGKGGSIYPGMIASNKKMRTLGELEGLARIDPTFACTMESPTEEISLVSETVSAIVDCPANNAIIEGISDTVPSTAGKTATYGGVTNLY